MPSNCQDNLGCNNASRHGIRPKVISRPGNSCCARRKRTPRCSAKRRPGRLAPAARRAFASAWGDGDGDPKPDGEWSSHWEIAARNDLLDESFDELGCDLTTLVRVASNETRSHVQALSGWDEI